MESIGDGGRRPHDQEIHVQGLRQLGGAERQAGMVQDTHLVGRQGQRPAAQHHRRSQRDRQHAQREHHRTGERLREGGTVRHHPARKQQRRHGRRHRAQQTGRQVPGVLLPVERRIPANVARPLAGLHQFQRQFPETHAAGDDDQRPRQKRQSNGSYSVYSYLLRTPLTKAVDGRSPRSTTGSQRRRSTASASRA